MTMVTLPSGGLEMVPVFFSPGREAKKASVSFTASSGDTTVTWIKGGGGDEDLRRFFPRVSTGMIRSFTVTIGVCMFWRILK